jgi:hypothetical protein
MFERLGGDEAMFKTGSPLLRKIIGEAEAKARRKSQRDDIITFLAARFGPEARALRVDLKTVGDARLKELLALAATCPDLAAFREQVPPRRRKRRD